MNDIEKSVVLKLADSWNEFIKLDKTEAINADDLNDFRKAIHDAKRIVMSREAQRNNLDIFNTQQSKPTLRDTNTYIENGKKVNK